MTDEALIGLIRKRSRRIRVLPSATRTTGSLPRPARAVIFDVYGTLLIRAGDTEPDTSGRDDGVGRLVRDHHLAVGAGELRVLLRKAILQDREEARARGVSAPEVRIEDIWRGLFPARDPGEIRQMIVEYELSVHPCWPMPGSGRTVSSLAKSGMTLGIISNAQFYTPLFLEALLGGRPEELGFASDLCFYSWIRGEAKPGRTMFEEAAARLCTRGIRTGQALVVGNDPVNDVAAASRCGFMTARLSADRRSPTESRERAEHASPDVAIARLADLVPVVRGSAL